MRTRMSGGVGRAARKGRPYPIYPYSTILVSLRTKYGPMP